MVRYRRNFVPGGTYFFTVTLADRRSCALVEHVGASRNAFRTARRERPFTIDAVVILPDHLHVVMTLPPGDPDFSGRWRRIKGLFTHAVDAGDAHRPQPQGRARTVAAPVLGAHDPGRQRPRTACRLHPYQSREAWPGRARFGLALLVVSSLRPPRIAPARLGRHCRDRRHRLWRTARMIRYRSSGLQRT